MTLKRTKTTIPDLVRIWREGDPERIAVAEPVERVLHLWYANGARLPKVDTYARLSPLAGPTVETQGWRYVDHLVPEILQHALVGVLGSFHSHQVADGLAFCALDILADAQREGHGFIGLRPERQNENVDASGEPNAYDQPGTMYETLLESGTLPEVRWADRIRAKIARDLGLAPKDDRRKPEKAPKPEKEERRVYLQGAQTVTEKKKGWNGPKK